MDTFQQTWSGRYKYTYSRNLESGDITATQWFSRFRERYVRTLVIVAFTCDSIYLYSKLQLECLFLAHCYHGHLIQVLSSTNDTMITMAYPGRIRRGYE